MKERTINVIKIASVLIILGIIYALFISRTNIAIPCIFNKITGLKCPGCGVTTMCLALLHFDIKNAFLANPAVFILMPFIIYILIKYAFQYIKHDTKQLTKIDNILVWSAIIILLIHAVIRNLAKF